jgi:hypothetical protein
LVWDGIVLDVNEEKEDHAQVNIYPNPTSDVFHIDGMQQGDVVRLMDSRGILVKSYTTSDHYDMRSLSAGLYFVQVTSKNREHVTVVGIVKM